MHVLKLFYFYSQMQIFLGFDEHCKKINSKKKPFKTKATKVQFEKKVDLFEEIKNK